MNPTLEQKKKILASLAAEAENEDKPLEALYHMLYNGLPGYKDASAKEIEEEWVDTIEDMDDDDIQHLVDTYVTD